MKDVLARLADAVDICSDLDAFLERGPSAAPAADWRALAAYGRPFGAFIDGCVRPAALDAAQRVVGSSNGIFVSK